MLRESHQYADSGSTQSVMVARAHRIIRIFEKLTLYRVSDRNRSGGIRTMYLSAENCFELDKIVKSFEVAYRSYVAAKIFNKFPDKRTFEDNLLQLKGSFGEKNSIVNSNKFYNKLEDIIKNRNDIYNALRYCNNCIIGQHYENSHVSEVLHPSKPTFL